MAKSKLGIDKEEMFSKIMPSSMLKKQNSDDAEKAELSNVNSSQNPSYATSAGGDTASVTPENKTPPISVIVQPSKTAALNPERQVELLTPTKRGTVMINVMEKLVVSRLDAALAKFNSCKCDRCRQDIAALALNKLSPKYIIVTQNELEDYIANADDSTVMPAIIQAIFTVRTHPRH